MTTSTAVRIAAGIICAVIGSALLLVALTSAGVAAAVEGVVGRTGVVTTSLGSVESGPQDVAVIADGVTARFEPPAPPAALGDMLALSGTDLSALAEDVGEFTLVVSSPAGEALFVGVAPPEEVNSYLDQAPYSVAVRDGQEWPTVSVPGTGSPSPPEQAGIWTAQAGGSPAELPAASLDGQTLVVMSPDASAGVSADLRLEYRVPGADRLVVGGAWTAVAASLAGLLLVFGGAWLVVGRRGGGARGRHQ